jgi:myosin III
MPRSDTKEKFNSRGLASQSRAQQTAATYFRYSLMDLLQKMIAGTPQFVRCIKPNDLKIKKNFEEQKVVKQLRYTGVLETIRIRQNGFSHRLLFADFLKKYCFLAFGYRERVVANRESCRLLLVRLKMDGYALGKSKVFLKYYHIEFLAKLYEEQTKRIVLVQAYVRRWLAKSLVHKLRLDKHKSALTLQKHVRGWLTRRKFKLLQQAKESQEKYAREEMENVKQVKRLEPKHKNESENQNRAALVIQTCNPSRASFVLLVVDNITYCNFLIHRFSQSLTENKNYTRHGGKN